MHRLALVAFLLLPLFSPAQTVSCYFVNAPTPCNGDDRIVLTLSATDNAHADPGPNNYPVRICCTQLTANETCAVGSDNVLLKAYPVEPSALFTNWHAQYSASFDKTFDWTGQNADETMICVGPPQTKCKISASPNCNGFGPTYACVYRLILNENNPAESGHMQTCETTNAPDAGYAAHAICCSLEPDQGPRLRIEDARIRQGGQNFDALSAPTIDLAQGGITGLDLTLQNPSDDTCDNAQLRFFLSRLGSNTPVLPPAATGATEYRYNAGSLANHTITTHALNDAGIAPPNNLTASSAALTPGVHALTIQAYCDNAPTDSRQFFVTLQKNTPTAADEIPPALIVLTGGILTILLLKRD